MGLVYAETTMATATAHHCPRLQKGPAPFMTSGDKSSAFSAEPPRGLCDDDPTRRQVLDMARSGSLIICASGVRDQILKTYGEGVVESGAEIAPL